MVHLRPHWVLALWFPVLLAAGESAGAHTIINGFTKAPTFTPPPGCVATFYAYGVVAECEKSLAPGRTFGASIDTAAGSFYPSSEAFLEDHIEETRQYWTTSYPRNAVTFSSKASDIVPGNAPPHETFCTEYSVTQQQGSGTELLIPSPDVTRNTFIGWAKNDAHRNSVRVHLRFKALIDPRKASSPVNWQGTSTRVEAPSLDTRIDTRIDKSVCHPNPLGGGAG